MQFLECAAQEIIWAFVSFWRYEVAQLVEALRENPECCGFAPRLLNPSGRTMSLGLAQLLREMSSGKLESCIRIMQCNMEFWLIPNISSSAKESYTNPNQDGLLEDTLDKYWLIIKHLNSRKPAAVKADPLQARSGPEGSRKLRFPDFVTTAQDGSKVANPTHRSPLPPGNTPGTHFC